MDVDAIFQDVSKVIAFSQGIQNPKVDVLKDKWLEAKRDFIEIFGGEPIYTVPGKVSFKLSDTEKSRRLNNFNEMVCETWGNLELSSFLSDIKDDFFQNITSKQYQYNGITIPKGMKIVKAFKFFEHDKRLLEEMQNYASRLIQEDKIEGELCFSVHPLDFLSSSENTYNWRSCHSLDGEYRAGNLSYMLDSSTVICYLRTEGEFELPNFPTEVKWNSKKWRMLLFLSEDWNNMFAGRQYPFSSNNALDIILNVLSEKLLRREFFPWSNTQIQELNGQPLFQNYIPINGYIIPLNELVIDPVNPRHFNDLLYSSCYIPYYTYAKNIFGFSAKKPVFNIGSNVPCVLCGEEDITLSDTMLCTDCELEYGHCDNEDIGYCECCGRRILMDDSYPVSVGYGEFQYVCSYCADTECIRCESCGNLVYSNDICFDRQTESYLCTDCYNDRLENKYRRLL